MTSKDFVLDFYSKPGKLTDLGIFVEQTENLSGDPEELSKVVQGLLIHDMWLERSGVKFTKAKRCTALNPGAEDMINTANKGEKNPDISAKAPIEKAIVCCREFAVMLASLLKAKGVPARARCGFATYLATSGYFEDHWITEYWDGTKWLRVDPQIDEFQLKSIKDWASKHKDTEDPERTSMLLNLNPFNLMDRDFITAGKAWMAFRKGKIDPNRYGLGIDPKIYGMESSYGEWFIRGNLIRDFLALINIEIAPYVEGLEIDKNFWEGWRLINVKDNELTKKDYKLLDAMAKLSENPNKNLKKIIKLYGNTPDLVPTKKIYQ